MLFLKYVLKTCNCMKNSFKKNAYEYYTEFRYIFFSKG